MKIVLLTSSRADYSIYRPLIRKLQQDDFFQLKVIAFGTHVSTFHGHTIQQIHQDKVEIIHQVETLILGDSPEAIATAMGTTLLKFSGIWSSLKSDTDLILCLGDRYEMLAAVLASTPFNIPVAHFHGGEVTLGAIDNKFRHSLTLMSDYHFTSTRQHYNKVVEMLGHHQKVFEVGALSLDNLHELTLLSIAEFQEKYSIDLTKPTILVTFHPETVSYEQNEYYVDELIASLNQLITTYQVVITMPNADTTGHMIRQRLQDFASSKEQVKVVESLGVLGYFSCMKHCAFLLGNTSSGIIEAASFGKYVINIGDRQKGREAGSNVLQVPVQQKNIVQATRQIARLPVLKGENIYGDGHTSDKIIDILKHG